MKIIIRAIIVATFLLLQIDTYSQDEIGSFELDGRTRKYEVYLPQNFQTNMPVVIGLHDYISSIINFKNTTQLHEAADTLGFITVYPQSSSISWDTGETDPPFDWGIPYDRTVDDVGFISALIDTINNHYNIDLNRFYCCGMSSGGEMAFRLAMELGHRLACAASVSGPINEVLGREVATLVNKEQPIGNYEVEFDASILTSGIYFYRIQADDFVKTKKMVLMK